MTVKCPHYEVSKEHFFVKIEKPSKFSTNSNDVHVHLFTFVYFFYLGNNNCIIALSKLKTHPNTSLSSLLNPWPLFYYKCMHI